MKAGADGLGFLGADDVRTFEDLLAAFLGDTGALCAFLVDRTGRLLSSSGDTARLDEISIASLAAGDFAASGQIATLLGEDEFHTLYHHGAERSMFLADIAGAAILVVLFDTRTTLGMVRIQTKSLVPRFAEYIALMAQRGPSGQVVQMESDWAAEADSQIDRLFTD